jgi:hypothetical protein
MDKIHQLFINSRIDVSQLPFIARISGKFVKFMQARTIGSGQSGFSFLQLKNILLIGIDRSFIQCPICAPRPLPNRSDFVVEHCRCPHCPFN